MFHHLKHPDNAIRFFSLRSGELIVTKNETLLTLNFPADQVEKKSIPTFIAACFQTEPMEAYQGKTDWMFVFKNETEIHHIQPDYKAIHALGGRGVIVTAPGDQVDFVSRFFAPQSGIDEDPVTGSAHTTLVPYWSEKLGKDVMTAIQLSNRKGYLQCKFLGERVEISGHAVTYLKGEIEV
jgi:PhzF family phenazine biosynthesis protein